MEEVEEVVVEGEVVSTGCLGAAAAVVGGGRTMRGRRALARGACDLALDAEKIPPLFACGIRDSR